MKKSSLYIVALALAAGCVSGHRMIELSPEIQRAPSTLAQLQEDYVGDIYPFFDEYCFSCHGDRRENAEVNLEAMLDVTSIGEHPELWDRVLSVLDSGQMPPQDKTQPEDADREEIALFVATELDQATKAMRPDPGHITAQRLNRQEYDNTIRDLLSVDTNPSRVFPVDDSGYGFDNIGDVLTVSPVLMEKYMTAAEEIIDTAMARRGRSFDPEKHAQIFQCRHSSQQPHVRDCAKDTLAHFARLAYRRPVAASEVRDLMKLVTLAEEEGDGIEMGVRLGLQAILVSPNFLFRIEQDQSALDIQPIRFVNDYELASRLSYFLWSSMPDEELFALAEKKMLHKPKVLEEQVKRMIADEKSAGFVDNFAGQWLQLRNVSLAARDKKYFPDFSSALRKAMRLETEMFFKTLMQEDASILNFLDSDFTYVNEVLAKHYGIEGITGDAMQRIRLEGDQRGGILTQASVLTMTSRYQRTSPVLRGAWILENILGTEPAPPPPDTPSINSNPAKGNKTFRQKIEAHRDSPACMSCHVRMDPLGFAFENYDATGKWRTEELGLPVDSTGVLPTGEAFEGSAQLKAILLANPDEFVHCFTEKMLTYALGRGVKEYDRPVVTGITERMPENEYRFQHLIQEIVTSVPFQMRKVDEKENA